MKRVTKLSLNVLAATVVAMGINGCSALKEGMAAQMEVPTLEKQANRVAVGMAIVRENNIMAYKMPISADAKWPSLVSAELDDAQKKSIETKIMNGPYFSTVQYSDPIQRKALGSGALMNMLGESGTTVAKALDQKVSPLTYRAVQKLEIFYGKDEKKWPDIFNFDGSLSNFLDFKNAKMQEIDSPTGDVHNTLDEAMISLIPVNLQKDLNNARVKMLEAFENVAKVNLEKAELETKLKIDEVKVAEKKDSYTPLTEQAKLETKQEISLLETKVKEAESLADEKELIYFELIDGAVLALESDIKLDDENYIKLAKNLNLASDQIQIGAIEAGTAFGLALSNVLANNIVLKFPTELESLKQAKGQVPSNLQDKYAQRIERLAKNAIYMLPNMAVGTYYAVKQASLAGKYKDVTGIILSAYETKLEQEREAQKAAKEAEEAAKKKVASK